MYSPAIPAAVPMLAVRSITLALLFAFSSAVASQSATLDFETQAPPEAPPPALEDAKPWSEALGGTLGLASVALSSNDAATAEKLSRQVVEEEPENADAWFLLGLALANQDKLEDALEPLTRAGTLFEKNAAPLVVKADILMALGRRAEAEASYQEAVKRDPTNWVAQESLGVFAEQANDLDLAAERYAKASLTAPGNRLFPRLQLSRIALLKDDPDLALSILSPIAAAGFSEDRLYDLLARAFLAKGDTDAARIYLNKLVDGGTSVFGYVGLARLDLSTGDAATAEKLLGEARTKWPSDPALALEYGNLQGALGRYADALSVYEGLLAADPDNIVLLRSVGLSLSRLGRIQEAVASAKSATALADAGSGDFAWLGSLQEMSGDSAAAIASYETAVARDPQNWLAQNNLASLLTPTDPARAVTLAEQAAAAAPDVAQVQDTLAWALFKSGAPAKAVEVYKAALASDPQNPTMLYRLGVIQIAQGQTDAGEENLKAALAADPEFPYAADARQRLGQN